MKKYIHYFVCILLLFSLCGCGSKNKENIELQKYKDSMVSIFNDLEKSNSDINKIDPNASDSMEKLYEQFDILETKFKTLSEIEVPEEFKYNETLANEAYEYMVQANDYLHQSFTDTSVNQGTLDASIECYKRANKRVQYIINIIHGELPKDENITYN